MRAYRGSSTPLRALAVVVGGAAGSAARLAVDIALPHSVDELPLSTLVVNILGAFLLGVVVTACAASAPAWLRAGLGTGVLGGFTTFSALSVAVLGLRAEPVGLVVTIAVSVFGGFVAATAGLASGAALVRWRGAS